MIDKYLLVKGNHKCFAHNRIATTPTQDDIAERQYSSMLKSLLYYLNRRILKNSQQDLVKEYGSLETKEEI